MSLDEQGMPETGIYLLYWCLSFKPTALGHSSSHIMAGHPAPISATSVQVCFFIVHVRI